MRYRVKGKQENCKMCLVCGLKNKLGLRASFYELENGELLAVFQPQKEHQSYPNRLHGGISAAILDETIGRAIMMKYEEDFWGMTIEFGSRYKKPVPLDEELRVIGRITKDGKRTFEGTGEILLKDGSVAVEGYGKYIKLPLDRISDFDHEEQEWRVVSSPDDPVEVEI
ncbi:PaaI family thioesterase [bacterium]|nr:PaaI family thioesterase [bacterium]RQV98967.1 MAG: PaaI family thioesterase [bacterium]